MAKVLVTGATGFIAGHVIHQLVEGGHEVTGTARSASRAKALGDTLSKYAGKAINLSIREADLSSDCSPSARMTAYGDKLPVNGGS